MKAVEEQTLGGVGCTIKVCIASSLSTNECPLTEFGTDQHSWGQVQGGGLTGTGHGRERVPKASHLHYFIFKPKAAVTRF